MIAHFNLRVTRLSALYELFGEVPCGRMRSPSGPTLAFMRARGSVAIRVSNLRNTNAAVTLIGSPDRTSK